MCNAREESLDHVMALCSTTRLVAAYMARWIEWWSVNEASAQALWTAICNDNIKEDPFSKLVRKAICVAFFWTMWRFRNDKVFNGKLVKEREICDQVQFLAINWIRGRCTLGKFLSWDNWICNPLYAVTNCNSLAPRWF